MRGDADQEKSLAKEEEKRERRPFAAIDLEHVKEREGTGKEMRKMGQEGENNH